MKDKIKKWKELSRNLVFEKYGRKIDKVVYELPSGKTEDFYIRNEKPVVCILALTKNNQVVLAQQFRPGPKEVLLELPGGEIEKGETAEQAASKELLEETGYSGEIKKIAEPYDCAYSTRIRHCLVATNCKKVSEPRSTDSEITQAILVSLGEFRDLLRSGKMTDVEVGYLGLDYLGLL